MVERAILFVHIPKTGGSAIFRHFADQGLKVLLVQQEKPGAKLVEDLRRYPLIVAHYTLDDLLEWSSVSGFDLSEVKLVTALRRPHCQFRSNLNFPFHLRAEGRPIPELWMRDALSSIDPDTGSGIAELLSRHRWLMNLQYQFLVTGGTLEERLPLLAHIGKTECLQETADYLSLELGLKPVGISRQNVSREFLNPLIWTAPPLRERLITENALDRFLYRSVHG